MPAVCLRRHKYLLHASAGTSFAGTGFVGTGTRLRGHRLRRRLSTPHHAAQTDRPHLHHIRPYLIYSRIMEMKVLANLDIQMILL